MIMFHGDPLLRRVNEIIDRVVQAGLYNYWMSATMNVRKLYSRKIALIHPLDGYYSFNLYHMQPAFYLAFMGWCLSVLCFMVELLYCRLLRKRMWSWLCVCCFLIFLLWLDLRRTWSPTARQPVQLLAAILKYLCLETVGMKKLGNPFLNLFTHRRRTEEFNSLWQSIYCLWSSNLTSGSQ